MRRYEQQEMKVSRRVLVELRCDLCGAAADFDYGWGRHYDEDRDVTVEAESGHGHAGCGDKTTTSFDICPGCFHEKLVPWLKAQGAEPRVEEIVW